MPQRGQSVHKCRAGGGREVSRGKARVDKPAEAVCAKLWKASVLLASSPDPITENFCGPLTAGASAAMLGAEQQRPWSTTLVGQRGGGP